MNNKETVTTKYVAEKCQPYSFVKGSKMSTEELNKRFNLAKACEIKKRKYNMIDKFMKGMF